MQKFVGGSARLKFKSFPETSDTMSNSGQLGKHLPAFNAGIRMVILIPRESPYDCMAHGASSRSFRSAASTLTMLVSPEEIAIKTSRGECRDRLFLYGTPYL
jgi:hypothetical protein